MKYFWYRETILATVAVFLLMGLLSLVPLNTHFLDPIKLALQDFDFNDLAYSELQAEGMNRHNEEIIILNIQKADRGQLADAIRLVRQSGAKAIGLDVLFEQPRDRATDNRLAAELQATPNLVLATDLNTKPSQGWDHFRGQASNLGYINLIGEEGGVIRSFKPSAASGRVESFPAQIARLYDEKAYASLISRAKEVEYIRFAYRPEQWIVLNLDQLMQDSAVSVPLLKNKIVLMGYVNYDPNDIEDKHFTPVNESFAGKSRPDMNGVLIQATILDMVLKQEYINKIPAWLNWSIAFFIVWVHMAFFIRYYVDDHLWFHLAAKTAQVISAILFVIIGLWVYTQGHLKLDMTATLAGIILAVDVLYFYEALMVWLNRKYGTKTIFQGHHPH